jgi:hypothetical protein
MVHFVADSAIALAVVAAFAFSINPSARKKAAIIWSKFGSYLSISAWLILILIAKLIAEQFPNPQTYPVSLLWVPGKLVFALNSTYSEQPGGWGWAFYPFQSLLSFGMWLLVTVSFGYLLRRLRPAQTFWLAPVAIAIVSFLSIKIILAMGLRIYF